MIIFFHIVICDGVIIHHVIDMIYQYWLHPKTKWLLSSLVFQEARFDMLRLRSWIQSKLYQQLVFDASPKNATWPFLLSFRFQWGMEQIYFSIISSQFSPSFVNDQSLRSKIVCLLENYMCFSNCLLYLHFLMTNTF